MKQSWVLIVSPLIGTFISLDILAFRYSTSWRLQITSLLSLSFAFLLSAALAISLKEMPLAQSTLDSCALAFEVCFCTTIVGWIIIAVNFY